jgi:hypothetical protein
MSLPFSESQCIERQRVSAVAIQKSIHTIQKVSLSESECVVVSALGRPRAFLNFPLIDISLNLLRCRYFSFNLMTIPIFSDISLRFFIIYRQVKHAERV